MIKLTKKRITFSVFDETTYANRQITVSHISLMILSTVMLLGISFFSYLLFTYYQLHSSSVEPLLLKNKILHQNQRLVTYNDQIKILNNKLSQLKTKIDNLQGIENQIREIARIKPSLNEDNLFGVGGSKSDSLETDIIKKEEMPLQPAKVIPATTPAETLRVYPIQSDLTLALHHSDFSINPITCLPSILPVSGSIVKQFQNYPSLLTGAPAFHKGLSIRAERKSRVISVANGIITSHIRIDNKGHIVVIDHGYGFTSRYTYLVDLPQQEGGVVEAGETIGFLSDTMTTTENRHKLYYEIFLNGIPVNPESFLVQCPFFI